MPGIYCPRPDEGTGASSTGLMSSLRRYQRLPQKIRRRLRRLSPHLSSCRREHRLRLLIQARRELKELDDRFKDQIGLDKIAEGSHSSGAKAANLPQAGWC